jgi:hypothetical protein
MKKKTNSLSFHTNVTLSLTKRFVQYGIILIFAALSLFQLSCNDDDNPTDPLDQLPPATQTGENTAGCLVNGKTFLPNNGSVLPLVLNYLDGEDFTLKISNETNNDLFTIFVRRFDTPLEEGETYLLNTEFSQVPSVGEYFINTIPPPSPFYYSTNSMITGELTITNFDFANAILSGTFWFDAINSEGDIVEVREGRFDMEY